MTGRALQHLLDERGEKLSRPGRAADSEPDRPLVGLHRQLKLKEPAALTFSVDDCCDLSQRLAAGVEPEPEAIGKILVLPDVSEKLG